MGASIDGLSNQVNCASGNWEGKDICRAGDEGVGVDRGAARNAFFGTQASFTYKAFDLNLAIETDLLLILIIIYHHPIIGTLKVGLACHVVVGAFLSSVRWLLRRRRPRPRAGGAACTMGKKGVVKQELMEVFQEVEGALACRTCNYVMSAEELEKGMQLNSGVGVLGKLSSHRKSTQHMGQSIRPTSLRRRAPWTTSSPGSRRAAAAAAAAATAATTAAARPGARRSSSTSSGSNWGGRQQPRRRSRALYGLVDNLSHADQHALVLRLSKKLLPCRGMGRPVALGGKPDLALHVPLSLFYKDGQYHRTNRQYVGCLVELRQGAFHSKKCTGLAEPEKQRCEPCLGLTKENFLEKHLPHIGKTWERIVQRLFYVFCFVSSQG